MQHWSDSKALDAVAAILLFLLDAPQGLTAGADTTRHIASPASKQGASVIDVPAELAQLP